MNLKRKEMPFNCTVYMTPAVGLDHVIHMRTLSFVWGDRGFATIKFCEGRVAGKVPGIQPRSVSAITKTATQEPSL